MQINLYSLDAIAGGCLVIVVLVSAFVTVKVIQYLAKLKYLVGGFLITAGMTGSGYVLGDLYAANYTEKEVIFETFQKACGVLGGSVALILCGLLILYLGLKNKSKKF